jgi:predicted site-specific integrase-resolvase
MTAIANHRKYVNPIHIAPLFKWLMLASIVASCGLLFVSIKNQQHFLGEQTRGIERQAREVRAQNEVLLARISTLSSRVELQRKLNQGFIALQPIQDHCIARIGQPVTAEKDGVLRTAANDSFRP